MPVLSHATRLTFKTDADKVAVVEFLRLEREIFNFVSERHYAGKSFKALPPKTNKKTGKPFKQDPLNQSVFHAAHYGAVKQAFPSAKSQLIVKALAAVSASYKTIRSNGHKIDGPARKRKLSFRYDCRTSSHREEGDSHILRLTTSGRPVDCEPHLFARLTEAFANGKLCDPVVRVVGDEVWAVLPFEVGAKPPPESSAVLGIDLGVCRAVATSDGDIFIDREHNARMRRVRHRKRCLKAKGTKSAERSLKKLRSRERNVVKDFRHRVAKAVIEKAPAILALEDLEVAKMIRGKKKSQTAKAGLGEMRSILTYKAALAGIRVVSVCPAYTSQTDSQTGEIKPGARAGRRFYASDSLVYDADWNAAINVARKAVVLLAQEGYNHPVSCRRSLPLDGQAVVNRPIAGAFCPASPRL